MLSEGLKEGVRILQKALEARELSDFALIGGLAVSRLGVVRATLDIDFGIRVGDKGLGSLVKRVGGSLCLGDGNDPLRSVLSFRTGGVLIQLIEFPPALSDVLFDAPDLATLDDIKFPAASLEALVLLKLYAGAPRDIEDIRGMLSVNSPPPEVLARVRVSAERLRLSKRLDRALSGA